MDSFLKAILRLPARDRAIWLDIVEKILSHTALETLDIKKLSGFKQLFRVRKGTMRLVFRVINDQKIIVSFWARGDAHKTLKGFRE